MSEAQLEDVLYQRCSDKAMSDGIKASVASVCVSGAAVFAANKWSSWFQRSFNVSAKSALVVMPTFGAYLLVSEITLIGSKRGEPNNCYLLNIFETQK